MPRVGRELLNALDEICGEPEYTGPSFIVATPRNVSSLISLRNINVVEVGFLQGAAWEQLELPFFARGRPSLNFTSTAPLVCRRGIVVIHDAQFRSFPSSQSSKTRTLYNSITPSVAKRFQAVVTGSHFAERELVEYGVVRRREVVVIPHAADHMLRFEADSGALTGLSIAPKRYVLANSYAHDHKNVRVLLQAVAGDPELASRLVLFGGGSRRDLEARGLSVPDGVKFTGRISNEELVALMKGSAGFLFPSRTEGFGLPPLEAMQLGTAVVCSRSGAMPEVCGDGAYFIDADDEAEWNRQMHRLIEDEQWRTDLGDRGRRRANSFRWRSSAEKYLELLHQLKNL